MEENKHLKQLNSINDESLDKVAGGTDTEKSQHICGGIHFTLKPIYEFNGTSYYECPDEKCGAIEEAKEPFEENKQCPKCKNATMVLHDLRGKKCGLIDKGS